MKKKGILFVFLIVLVFFLGLDFVSAGVTISVDNYYPSPVEAGDYFNVQLQIVNDGGTPTDAIVKFKATYPFSLDPGYAEEEIINNLGAGGAVTRKFKVRVDAGAKDGENPLTFEYKDCLGCVVMEKSFSITVLEAQTMFDVVLQELNSEGVFIAIANIGKNPANAVTVRIPEQENFATQLVSASIVGNLASGDYTLVGFQIIPKIGSTEEKELKIQIDYTDPLGVRRTVFKTIMLKPSSLRSISSQANFTHLSMQKSSFFNFLKDYWFWVSVILVLIIIRKTVYRYLRRIKS